MRLQYNAMLIDMNGSRTAVLRRYHDQDYTAVPYARREGYLPVILSAPYQQNAARFTTLPEALEPTKEEQEQRSSNEDTEANKRKVVAGGFMSKRVCRLEMKAVLIIAAILFFVTIGDRKSTRLNSSHWE